MTMGGNVLSDVLNGPGPMPSTGGPMTNAAKTNVFKVQLSISVLFLFAVGALMALHVLGFRFSIIAG